MEAMVAYHMGMFRFVEYADVVDFEVEESAVSRAASRCSRKEGGIHDREADRKSV